MIVLLFQTGFLISSFHRFGSFLFRLSKSEYSSGFVF